MLIEEKIDVGFDEIEVSYKLRTNREKNLTEV